MVDALLNLTAEDAASCSSILAQGSRSFGVAARLLPRRVRGAATALYAFCRAADDAIDSASVGTHHAALAALSARLDAIYAAMPQDFPEDRGFARVVARYHIPKTLPAALLEGFAWDAQGRNYANLPELLGYAARVAGSVGVMMALIMGAKTPAALVRACDLGMAMQLSNIARDIGEDARMGRLYLPQSWLIEENIDPQAFLAAPVFSAGVAGTVARLLEAADRLYRQGATGIADLPRDCRLAIHASRRLYQAIGHAAGAVGFNPVEARAVVPAGRKSLLIARALGDLVMPQGRKESVFFSEEKKQKTFSGYEFIMGWDCASS